MLRLGIIGAENTHTVAVAKLLNVDKAVGGLQVTHVWGETPELAGAAAEAGRIPAIVGDPREMLGQVDCVMVDHRHGKYHLPAVTPFVKAGIPCFVDKPMSTSLAEAKRFLRLRREVGVPVTTFSLLPLQPSVKFIKEALAGLGQLRAVHLTGPGNYRGPYGGIFFYGIHQVDLMVELLGAGARSVDSSVNGANCTLLANYPDDLTVTMALVPTGVHGWTVTAVGAGGAVHLPVPFDADANLPGVLVMANMFKTGVEPFGDKRMLAPVAILEALQRSLDENVPVKAPRLV